MVFIRLSQDKYKKLPWRNAKYEDWDDSFYVTWMTKEDATNALLKEIQNRIDKFNKLLLSPPIKIIDD